MDLIIIDDHQIVRDGLKAMLLGYPEYSVKSEAASAAEAIQKLKSIEVDLAFVDLRLPDLNGALLIKELLSVQPSLKCILLTAEPNALDLERAKMAGALGFLTKNIDAEEYIRALSAVSRGERYVSQEFSNYMLDENHQLSIRELEVLQLIADGLPYKQIAGELGISARTVETHKNNCLSKLGVGTPIEMVRKALILGLIKG